VGQGGYETGGRVQKINSKKESFKKKFKKSESKNVCDFQKGDKWFFQQPYRVHRNNCFSAD
jgi:hypothetical protein